MSTPLSPTALVLRSDCTVTVAAATNYAQELPREEVQTLFSLRFVGALPFKLRAVKEAEALAGFELLLTGPDECVQLIKALELAVSELRWQADLPVEEVPYTPAMAQVKSDAEARWFEAEVAVLELMAFSRDKAVVGGPTVGRFLRSQLRQLPLVATGNVWELLLRGMAQETAPTLEELAPQVENDNGALSVLRDLLPAEAPEGWKENPSELRQQCQRAVDRYYQTALRVLQLDLMERIEQESDAGERQALLVQLRTLENQQAYLARP